MIYSSLYQNSFVAAIVAFLALLVIFFVFDIAPTVKIVNGQVKHTVNWKYPLAISILVFLLWYFLLFPPEAIKPTFPSKEVPQPKSPQGQVIDMKTWL